MWNVSRQEGKETPQRGRCSACFLEGLVTLGVDDDTVQPLVFHSRGVSAPPTSYRPSDGVDSVSLNPW